jgi:hypothetical protein
MDEQLKAIDAFTHFLYHAEPDFVEKVWCNSLYLAKHLGEKLDGFCNRYGNYMGVEALVRFNQELTWNNQQLLYKYIIENHSNKWR